VFRRFLIAVLLFLVVIVVAADRVGAIVGAHVLASKLKSDERLSHTPSTSIGGFPFLTQAFGGKYNDVTVTAHDVQVNAVTVTTLTAHLHGVHLPFSKVIHGSVSQVPVDRVEGTAFVSFADANSYLGTHGPTGSTVSLAAGLGGKIRVVEKVRVHGQALSLSGLGAVTVTGDDDVTVGISDIRSTGAIKAAARRIVASLPSRLRSVTIPLPELPFRFQLTSVTVSSTGITASGTASNIVLGNHPNR
jgi:LmeA-like phospholipid-binding